MKSKRAWSLVATMHLVWGMLAFAVYANWPNIPFTFQVVSAYLGFWLGVIIVAGGIRASVEAGEEV